MLEQRCVWMAAVLGLLLAVADAPRVTARQGPAPTQAMAETGTVLPNHAAGPLSSQPPILTAEQMVAREAATDAANPLTPFPAGELNPLAAMPIDPPTDVVGPLAATDFNVQVSHALTEIPASQRSAVHEPSLGSMGNTIFYSANWYAAVSSNGGETFSYVNPATTFPSVNGGFCCDQIVHYAPTQDMMIWAVQYIKDSTSGTLRLARAVGSSAVVSNSWTYYDFTPQMFGFASGNWMDFPNLTVSSNYVYATSNVFLTSNDTFSGSVVWRIPLTQLAAGGVVNFDYFTRTDTGSTRCSEGATTTMHCGAILSNAAIRVYNWVDASGTYSFDDVAITPFTRLLRDGVATSPDGTNWAARADSRILGAWAANGVLGYMWMAKQGGSFPYPYTIIARFNQSTRALIGENQIWNSSYAWLYPTVSPNAAGNLAGLIYYGGGSYYPNAAYWIVDDVEPAFAPLAVYAAGSSSAGPLLNRWGDYVTVRKHKQFPNTWVGGFYTMGSGGGDADALGRYAWFGRMRDLPAMPPTVTTNPASGIGATSATLNGTVNPNGTPTTGRYEYGLTTAYGFMTPIQALGSGTAATALGGGAIAGLTCGTLYHFRAIASNSVGPSFGLDAIFTTAACTPGAFNKTAPGNGVTNQPPTVTLSWGTSALATSYGFCVDTSNNNVCDTSWVASGGATTAAVGNLSPSTTYYWQARAANVGGTTEANAGTWWSFTTQAFRAARLTQPSPSVRLPGQIVPFSWDAGVSVVQYSLFVGSAVGAGDIYMQNQSGLSRFVTVPTDGRLIYVRLYSRIGDLWVYNDTIFLAALAPSSTFDFGIVPMRGDYDGDGVADLVTWWGASGIWQIVRSSSSYTQTTELSWGRADLGDRPVMGDFDGDGKADPAVWREGPGLWLALRSSTNYMTALQISWGRADLGDVPVPADFDGDGKTDPAVWRRGTGHWYALRSATNYAQYIDLQWGREDLTDRPVPGDYDGDNKADPAVWRALTGEWFILRSTANYANYIAVSWGRENETDQPVPADYDGDGRTDIAVWRRATGFWYILKSSTSFMGQAALQLGNLALGDRPVPGRFVNGDLKVDPAVWRGSTGTWMMSASPVP